MVERWKILYLGILEGNLKSSLESVKIAMKQVYPLTISSKEV